MVGVAKSLGKEGAGKGLGRAKRHSSWREGCGEVICEGCGEVFCEGCGEVFCDGCWEAFCDGCGEAFCDGCSGSSSDGDNSCDTCMTLSDCDTENFFPLRDEPRGSSKKSKLNNHKAGRNFDGKKAVTKARIKKINSAKITNHMAVKEKTASRKGGTKRIARTEFNMYPSWERSWREGCGEVFCNVCSERSLCEGCGEFLCDGCSGSSSDGDNTCDTCVTLSDCDTDDSWDEPRGSSKKSKLNNHKAGRNFDGEKAVTKARVKKINSAKITNHMAVKEKMASRKGGTKRIARTDEPPDIMSTSSRGSSKKTKLNNQKAGQNFDGGKAVTRARVKKINSAQKTNRIAVKEKMASIKGGTKRTVRTDEAPDIVSTSSPGSSKKAKLNNQKAGQNFDGGKVVTRARVKKINSAQITNRIAVKEKMASIKGGTKRTVRTVMKGEHHENDRQAWSEGMRVAHAMGDKALYSFFIRSL